MCPMDPTPLGDEMVRRLPERKFPQPRPGARSAEENDAAEYQGSDASQPDIDHRPALPDHPVQMAVDVEDEEADPVIDHGPGIADGPGSLNKQRG